MNVKDKIISEIFEDSSKRYYIRELARKARVNPNSVINVIKELEKTSLIKKDVKKHIVEIIPNLNNPKFIAKKRIFNLAKIYNSDIISFLIKTYNPKSIVLFGSFSRGEDIKKSDIDIAVVTDKKDIVDIGSFEKKLKRTVHISLIQYRNISEELYNSLINGIVLYGYIDKV